MTAGELVAALQMAREVGEVQVTVPGAANSQRESVAGPAAAAADDENVTALSTARQTK
jgi:hypothetical protein